MTPGMLRVDFTLVTSGKHGHAGFVVFLAVLAVQKEIKRFVSLATAPLAVLLAATKKKSRFGFTDEVQTTSGPVIGKTVRLPTGKKIDKYLGIKYAQAKRFEKPESPTPWTEPFYADSFGKFCIQFPFIAPAPPEVDEDCLFINVFVPHRRAWANGELFSVMHWIHGGAVMFNSGDQPGADILASEGDVIVVTFNYRLGALGYLASGSSDLPGNYGMFDQIKALQWTKDNIKNFGGDPTKVTLFGESTGGFSTSLHVISPKSANLFRYAIAQSGPGIGISSYVPTNLAHGVARRFAEKIGCEMASLKTCLLSKTADEILTAQGRSFVPADFLYLIWGPVVDGDFLPDSPENLLSAGNYNAKNIMMGVNNDEAGLFLIPMVKENLADGVNRDTFELALGSFQWTRNQTKENLDSILYQYTNWDDPEDPITNRRNLIDVITDPMFAAPSIKTAQAYASNSIPTYFYQLQHGPDYDYLFGKMPDWLEAYHGADINYMFGIPLLKDDASPEDSEVKFSMDLMKMWSDFAKIGNPTPSDESVAQWPQYTLENEEYLGLKPDDFQVQSHLRGDLMRFWNEYIPKQTCSVKSCEGQPDGVRFPYPGDCTKYHECQGGIAVVQKCPFIIFPTYFSKITERCLFFLISGCLE